MNKKQWIKSRLEFHNNDINKVYKEFEDYNKEFDSKITYSSYERSVRKARGGNKSVDSSTLSRVENGNELTVISRSKDIRTLEDLIIACKIDLKLWQVTSWKANKWSTPLKVGDEVSQVDNYQVKASLAKRTLDPTEFEPLKILNIITKPNKVLFSDSENILYQSALILSDAQIGFIRDLHTDKLKPMHDRNALSITLKVAKDTQPNQIIINGDMLDLSDWSDKFLQSPEFSFLLQKGLIELGWWISQFHNVAPNAKISFIPGNHEQRMERGIIRNFPLAFGLKSLDNIDAKFPLLSLQNMIKFDKFDLHWEKQYPYGEIWLNPKTRISHGKVIAQGSGATAVKVNKLSNNNEIFGHIHRIETAVKTVYDHQNSYSVGAYSFGCLCKTDGSVPSNIPNVNWQQGFGMVTYNEKEEYIETILIKNKKAIYDKKIYLASKEIDKQLYKELGF